MNPVTSCKLTKFIVADLQCKEKCIGENLLLDSDTRFYKTNHIRT